MNRKLKSSINVSRIHFKNWNFCVFQRNITHALVVVRLCDLIFKEKFLSGLWSITIRNNGFLVLSFCLKQFDSFEIEILGWVNGISADKKDFKFLAYQGILHITWCKTCATRVKFKYLNIGSNPQKTWTAFPCCLINFFQFEFPSNPVKFPKSALLWAQKKFL